MILTDEMLNLYEGCVKQAATDVLATYGVAIQPQDDLGEMTSHDVIIGIISLVGDAELSVFIGLPRSTATALVAKFAGFEIPYDSSDMGDAIGELANMLGGMTKTLLDTRGIKVNISLPTVIRAQDIHVLTQRGTTSAKIGLSSDTGPLWVGVVAGQRAGFVA